MSVDGTHGSLRDRLLYLKLSAGDPTEKTAQKVRDVGRSVVYELLYV